MKHIDKMTDAIEDAINASETPLGYTGLTLKAGQAAFDALIDTVPDLIFDDTGTAYAISGTYHICKVDSVFYVYFRSLCSDYEVFQTLEGAKTAINAHNHKQIYKALTGESV